jgi:hypothetical protein
MGRREESRETAKALCHATHKKQGDLEVRIPNGPEKTRNGKKGKKKKWLHAISTQNNCSRRQPPFFLHPILFPLTQKP